LNVVRLVPGATFTRSAAPHFPHFGSMPGRPLDGGGFLFHHLTHRRFKLGLDLLLLIFIFCFPSRADASVLRRH
jgi:hypothetical protein